MVALTIGMATYNDFDGVYFTIQALRLYQDLEDTELLVVDNYGCETTRNFLTSWSKVRYVLATELVGTSAPRDRVFQEAQGKAVLCCDSHVLFAPGAIARLRAYYRDHPKSRDLLQGPLLYDDMQNIATHFDPVWRDMMWGIWANDSRGSDDEAKPFDIPMQGLGVFSCRKKVWPGFNPAFRGFGGEEGYIHEKFRQRGGRTLCLPWLRWVHRFGRPRGVPYPLQTVDRVRNYLIGYGELGLDPKPILDHFGEHLSKETIAATKKEARRVLKAQQPGKGKKGKKAKQPKAAQNGKRADEIPALQRDAGPDGQRVLGAVEEAANAPERVHDELARANHQEPVVEDVAAAATGEDHGPYPDGLLFALGSSGNGQGAPALRPFPLASREDGESEEEYVLRAMRLVEEAVAAGSTHLLIASEAAEWLGDHPLLTEYFSERHDLVAASMETGFVIALRAGAPEMLAAEPES